MNISSARRRKEYSKLHGKRTWNYFIQREKKAGLKPFSGRQPVNRVENRVLNPFIRVTDRFIKIFFFSFFRSFSFFSFFSLSFLFFSSLISLLLQWRSGRRRSFNCYWIKSPSLKREINFFFNYFLPPSKKPYSKPFLLILNAFLTHLYSI